VRNDAIDVDYQIYFVWFASIFNRSIISLLRITHPAFYMENPSWRRSSLASLGLSGSPA